MAPTSDLARAGPQCAPARRQSTRRADACSRSARAACGHARGSARRSLGLVEERAHRAPSLNQKSGKTRTDRFRGRRHTYTGMWHGDGGGHHGSDNTLAPSSPAGSAHLPAFHDLIAPPLWREPSRHRLGISAGSMWNPSRSRVGADSDWSLASDSEPDSAPRTVAHQRCHLGGPVERLGERVGNGSVEPARGGLTSSVR